MTTLQEDFVTALESFWTQTVGVVTLADSLASASLDPSKLVVTSSQPSGTQQEAEAYVKVTTAADVAPELWVRLGLDGVNFTKGYGVRLTMVTATTATLEILHASYPGGFETIAAIATSGAGALTPALTDSNGLNVEQHLRLVVFERMTDSEAPERLETFVRAYLNETHDDTPTVEIIHKGGTGGTAYAVWRDAGTYAIRFRDTTGSVDSWAARDDYVGPTYDVLPGDRTTLGVMRSALEAKLTMGGLSNYDATTILNPVILETCRSIVSRLGDKALFMERFTPLDITSSGNYTATLPRDVMRVIALYDSATMRPMSYQALAMDEQGRQILSMAQTEVGGRGVLLHYFGKIKPPTSDAHYLPIPSMYDECVLHGALMRIAGLEQRQDLLAWATESHERAYQELLHSMTTILRTRRLAMRVTGPRRRGTPFGYGNLANASLEWNG